MSIHSEAPAPTSPETVLPADIAARLQAGAVLIDVRDADAWAKANIPGATHVSLTDLETAASSVIADTQALVICYCNGGTRGPRGAALLRSLGYERATHVEGGLRAYMAMIDDTHP